MPPESPASPDPLAGFCRPGYASATTLVNLMATLIRARGGESPHPGWPGLPEHALARARHLVYLIVDGAGCAQLARYRDWPGPKGPLGEAPAFEGTSVVPATTAAAVTTLMSGASPAEHGVLGWFLNLHDLGAVATILPLTTRTDTPLAGPAFDLARYLAIPNYTRTVRTRRCSVSYGALNESRYTLACTEWDESRSADTLEEFAAAILGLCASSEPSLIYAYWPGYDHLAHQHGWAHERSLGHLAEIDRTLGALLERLGALDAALVVTADHGFIDTPELVDLAAIPGLYDCLATLPSGDPRQVHCFVRPARVRQFLKLIDAHLGERCAVVRGDTLLGEGIFGPGTPHPALAGRVGDYVLIARDGVALAAPPAGKPAHRMAANHGGLSAAEMRIPVFCFVP